MIDRILAGLRAGGDVPAVIDGAGACSRRELLDRAMTVASALPRGERVGLLAPRGREETAFLLGAMAAGAVPVPLETAAPERRNREILARCAGRGLEGEAILLHTSGSTGVPKGVPVTRAGVAAFVEWMTAEFDVRPGDRVASLSGPSFDLFLFEQLAPLAAGGTILRPPDRVLLSARVLARFLDGNGAAFVYAVPSLYVRLLDGGPLPPLKALRTVLFAGEVFPPGGLRRLRAALPGRAFANLFGPTETNVSLFHRVREGEPGEEPLPVGVPTPYAEVAIDEGEICVRGPTVLQRYVGEGVEPPRWVVLPGRGPAPFLRTGDLGEVGADGLHRFHGRRDGMLKVRGYRVEPGEVEAALASHPGVAEALVTREVEPGLGEVLVATVVAAAGAVPDPRDLRAHVALRLPPWMVPVKVAVTDSLPRTPRGKRARPAPG